MVSTDTGFSMFFGYFLAKFVEWLKTNQNITWLHASDTVLIQFLTALCSFAWALGLAYGTGRAFENWDSLAILWDALSAIVAAEITYHKTLKNENMTTVQFFPENPEKE